MKHIQALIVIIILLIGNGFAKEYTKSKMPSTEGYKSFPSDGGPIFVFNNSNTQTVRIVEATEEQTTITPSTFVIQPAQQQQTTVSANPEPQSIAPLQYESTKVATHTTVESLQIKKSDCHSWISQLTQLFSLKNGILAVGTVATIYGIIWTSLNLLETQSNNKEGWGSFKQEIPAQHLQAIPLNDLAQALIEEIQKKYGTHNRNNVIPLLLAFNNEVEKEQHDLEYYLSWCRWLNKGKLLMLFPNHKHSMVEAVYKVQRLLIFKKAIAYWIAMHEPHTTHPIE